MLSPKSVISEAFHRVRDLLGTDSKDLLYSHSLTQEQSTMAGLYKDAYLMHLNDPHQENHRTLIDYIALGIESIGDAKGITADQVMNFMTHHEKLRMDVVDLACQQFREHIHHIGLF